MSNPVTSLRSEAEALVRSLPELTLQVNAASAPHPGAAGRKKGGQGEQFWQYRRYSNSDAAERIDWRRSARSDEYYVRETELETARTILFWCDSDLGFDWSGQTDRPTKAARARVLMLCAGIQLSAAGERIGVLGGARPPSAGRSATNRLAEDLLVPGLAPQTQARGERLLVLASDFYSPLEALEQRIETLSPICKQGILLAVTDPIEHSFPFSGRVRFRQPGQAPKRLLGRAEKFRDSYISRFKSHQDDLDQLAARAGWHLVRHRTDEMPLQGASDLQSAFHQLGVSA